MPTKPLSYEEWLVRRDDARARCDAIDALLPPPRRLRPRDPDEAKLLRSMGTIEGLIGPVPDRGELDQVRALLYERLGDEREAEQWLWYRPNAQTGGRPPVAMLVEGGFEQLLEIIDQLEP